MIKSFAALSITTGVRLLTGLVLFVLLAREWSVGQFGQFMYLFSIAALLVLACEFGFTQQILREIGRAPSQARTLMGEYLGAKVWLTLLTACLALGFAWLTDLSANDVAVLSALLLAALFMSYADFLMACFRALGSFGEETKLTVWGNLLFFVLACAALFGVTDTALMSGAVAGAMATARAVQLLMTWRVFKRRVPEPLQPAFDPSSSIATIKKSSAYGADVAVGAAFTNLDTVLIAHTLGAEGVGVYQAIARIYQGMVLLPAILGSLFLPRLSRSLDDAPAFQKNCQQLSLSLLVGGAVAAAFFVWGGPLIALVYNDNLFQRSAELLPWFALFVFVRFVASIHGVVLTALGRQGVRALIYVVALVVMVATAPYLLQHHAESGMVMASTLAYALLGTLFAIAALKNGQRPHLWKTSALVSLSLMAFCAWKAGIIRA